MIAEGGGFAATLDADSEGVEGKFYVWDETEVDALLGPDAALFKEIYDVYVRGQLGRQQHPEPHRTIPTWVAPEAGSRTSEDAHHPAGAAG